MSSKIEKPDNECMRATFGAPSGAAPNFPVFFSNFLEIYSKDSRNEMNGCYLSNNWMVV